MTDLGPLTENDFRTRYEKMRAEYTKKRLSKAQEHQETIMVPEIHSEFDIALNKHLLRGGRLGDFKF